MLLSNMHRSLVTPSLSAVPTNGARKQKCFDRDATSAEVCGKKNTEGMHNYGHMYAWSLTISPLNTPHAL